VAFVFFLAFGFVVAFVFSVAFVIVREMGTERG
jgi:hypothetical protein